MQMNNNHVVLANAAVVAETTFHNRRTRRGHVLRIVEESYLRTDLGLGSRHGRTLGVADFKLPDLGSGNSASIPLAWLVPDTNVLLHQLDLLESVGCPALDHIVVLETVADEVKHNNLGAYKRLQRLLASESRKVVFFANDHCQATYVRRATGESPNDRNDRAIRVAASWLSAQLNSSNPATSSEGGLEGAAAADAATKGGSSASSTGTAVMLLSDDRLNREAVKAMPLSQRPQCASMRQLTRRLAATFPHLEDLVAVFEDSEDKEAGDDDEGSSGGSASKRRGGGGGSGGATVDNGGPQGAKSKAPRSASSNNSGSAALYQAHLPEAEVAKGVLSGKLFQGTLRCSRTAWDACYVVVEGRALGGGAAEAEERISVLVNGAEHVNRAMEGDLVAIEILPMDQWAASKSSSKGKSSKSGSAGKEGDASTQKSSKDGDDNDDEDEGGTAKGAEISEPTAAPAMGDLENVGASAGAGGGGGAPLLQPAGRVVGIVRRAWKHYCGSIAQFKADEALVASSSGSGTKAVSVLVQPVDRRIPRIRITTRQRDALEGKRLIVAVDSWPMDSKYPRGHYVSTLGSSGDKAVETAVLLLEHDIPTSDFTGQVLACLPPEGYEITEAEIADQVSKGRRDLRALPVMSIDPPGCRDIDDALHWRLLANGNWEVGVHIADVTHFMPPSTPLDAEAAYRSTSTYLVDKRLDMLPKMLTEKLCSLVGNKDRFAFSVLLEVTPEAEVVSADFCKSIIHSIGAHTYGEAQEMLDDKTRNDTKAQTVRHLNHLAKAFRAKRMAAGALTLASPEVRFVLDQQTQNPLDVAMYDLKETNALVEEFMLLANITVAKKVLRHFPTLGLLRRHPAPAKTQFGPLVSAAAAAGFEIRTGDSRALADSLDEAVRSEDPYFNKLLRIVCTRCMAPAQYFSSGEQLEEEWRHYGLATPVYTHFTSPIRRYADVVVHRLLAAAIGVGPLPPQLEHKGGLHDLAENMNRRHRSAQLAGRASVQLHTQLYFKDHPAVNEKAYVLATHPDKLVVLVPRFGIEGTIWLNDASKLNGDEVSFDADAHQVTVGPHQVTVFQAVAVHISVVVMGPGEGQHAVRVLLTEPPIGEQPSSDTASSSSSSTSTGKGAALPGSAAAIDTATSATKSKRKADSKSEVKAKRR